MRGSWPAFGAHRQSRPPPQHPLEPGRGVYIQRRRDRELQSAPAVAVAAALMKCWALFFTRRTSQKARSACPLQSTQPERSNPGTSNCAPRSGAEMDGQRGAGSPEFDDLQEKSWPHQFTSAHRVFSQPHTRVHGGGGPALPASTQRPPARVAAGFPTARRPPKTCLIPTPSWTLPPAQSRSRTIVGGGGRACGRAANQPVPACCVPGQQPGRAAEPSAAC